MLPQCIFAKYPQTFWEFGNEFVQYAQNYFQYVLISIYQANGDRNIS